jgi:hypothetical protein
MSWTATRNGKNVDVSGPVGDTLKITITSTSSAFTWTGWSWTGAVKQTASGSAVSSFSFTDTSTSGALNLVATIADTSTWTADDAMWYAIEGSKSGETYTLVQGKVVPTTDWV